MSLFSPLGKNSEVLKLIPLLFKVFSEKKLQEDGYKISLELGGANEKLALENSLVKLNLRKGDYFCWQWILESSDDDFVEEDPGDMLSSMKAQIEKDLKEKND